MRRAVAAIVAGSCVAGAARAHERDFTLSRDWHLPAQHEHEVESLTFWDPRPNDLVQQLEVEYGMTDHVALEPGVSFTKPNADRFELDRVDAEVLFNFRDFGFNRILPAFDVEYERRLRNDDDAVSAGVDDPKNAIGVKGILSCFTERGEDVTVNLNVERVFGDGEHAFEGEFTAGYVHPLDFVPGFRPAPGQRLNVGLEFTQQLSQEKFTGVGPVVNFSVSRHFHAVTTFVYAVNKRSDHFDELRLILEWEF